MAKAEQVRIINVPDRRDYKPEDICVCDSFYALPFVSCSMRGLKKESNWQVPPTDDFEQAYDIGREYAAHYLQYIKDNPCFVGENLLGHIAADIDFSDESGAKGYWVGFFTHLDRLLYAAAQRIDVFADVDKIKADYAENQAKHALEAKTGE